MRRVQFILILLGLTVLPVQAEAGPPKPKLPVPSKPQAPSVQVPAPTFSPGTKPGSATSGKLPLPTPNNLQSQQAPTSLIGAIKALHTPDAARKLYDKLLAQAKQAYPKLAGQPKQKHHIHPQYLGGPANGPTVDLDPAYHQFVTNAFRRELGYGQPVPSPQEQQRIMLLIYSLFPLPGVHF